MAQLAWLPVVVGLLMGGCATGPPALPDARSDPPRAQERAPETGGGGGGY
ncbi:MAG: hypothetical protein L0027_05485 [Candidatus Rokubacteria bacterium]|nr:hypothetical protein [Candidatus Rokubacteria bacterium]